MVSEGVGEGGREGEDGTDDDAVVVGVLWCAEVVCLCVDLRRWNKEKVSLTLAKSSSGRGDVQSCQ